MTRIPLATTSTVKHRQPKRAERVYRVVGREFRSDPYARTWTYKRLSDAEWRAGEVVRRGVLVAFDVADIEWRPTHQSNFPRGASNGRGSD